MKKVKITLVSVICVLVVLGITLAATVSDSGQHLYDDDFTAYVGNSNGTLEANGTSSIVRSYGRNNTGSSRTVSPYVYSYWVGSTSYSDRNYNTQTTSGDSWIGSGTISRDPNNYNRYYEHYCYIRIPVSNTLTDTYKYTTRQDQGY